MIVWLLAGLGLLILLLAGDALVKGAVNLSLRVGIPALIVSLTIVAFGTSAPELLISVNAVLDDKPGLGLGNVVGSNTANILLVLGVPALMTGLHTSQCDTRKTYLFMIGATVIFIGLAFRGTFDMLAGGLLLGMLAFVLADAFREARNHRRACAAAALDPDDEEEVEGADPNMPWWQIYVFLVLGLVGLPLGADLLVDNASIIARRYGVSDSVIGLTLVALGTSLPELATTVMAALRRQADVALGNVIGSNLFNLLAIIGITTMIGEIPVDPEFLQFDLWVMLGASLLLGPFVLMKIDINRIWGIVLTALYLVYVTFILT
ncbi:calcium/sodium antiporter [Roseovarius indicus]|uniref:Inner membrane protein YrbG n=1 Tax=Roseovarius indicus TaxID=540747 RepID=A0A0T5P9H2_9RHOB|nr:calcium/sodium antiporter [Roseovarius indicus]KRS17665.1 sodium:proton exchanger [Roseovarius indicus]QEW24592.1 Inner membrane protein YrbG [Roseovarius indicus]SFE26463.1 cation:H+ antiporter [Roseovarius indicus]